MGEIIELTLDALAHGGDAIGRHNGKAVFVPYAIPGEQARVEITDDRKRYARARLLEVLTPSPARVEPPCPHFGAERCGGCQWQHIAYPVQARLKGLVVIDQLERIGKFEDPPVLEPLPDATGWAYRNHALFRVNDKGHLGFLSTQSHTIYPIDECLILHPLLSELRSALDMAYPELEWMELRAGIETGDLMLVLQAKEEESPSLVVDFPLSIVQLRHDDAIAPLIGLGHITEITREREFRVSATSFYQVNSRQVPHLVDMVLEALALNRDEAVLDAYCGVGLFTAFMSESAHHVIAIEAHHTAVLDAQHNLAQAENVDVLEGPVETVLPTLSESFDAAVVDPPRTGLDRKALDALADQALSRLVYVSCDPATLARDARRLVNHGYALQWVQPIDMFPQTYHIENVALFTP